MLQKLNQIGSIRLLPVLFIATAVGLISFLLVSSTAPFQGGFASIFPKPFSHAAGNNFYVDCNAGNDSNAGTAPSSAWRTISKANNAVLGAGDNLNLMRGCTFTGPLNARWTGTATQPVMIQTYGSGAIPVITGSASELISVTGSYQVLDSLAIRGIPDHTDPGCNNQTVGYRHGVAFQPNSNHNILRNSDLTILSVGIDFTNGSSFNTATKNVLRDVNMMFTLTPTSVNSDDDGGAQAILLSGDNNDISYNTFTGITGCMYDYERVAGTSIVVYGGQHNSIHHNRSSANGANFVESGWNRNIQRIADDNTFAYNIVTDSTFISVHGLNDQWGPSYHNKLYNNVAYSTGPGPVNCASGCGTNILTMRNNIIWSKDTVVYANTPYDEANNLYWSSSGAGGVCYSTNGTACTTPPASDIVADPRFVNPAAGDFHLQSTSPAINKGSMDSVTAGFNKDYTNGGVPVGGSVDMGAYEFGSTSATAAPSPSSNPTSVPTPAGSPGTNILQNGSFDTGGVLTPWALFTKPGAAGTLSLDTSTKVDGLNSARIDITQSNPTSFFLQLIQNNFNLVPGQQYTLSFWARSSQSTATIDVAIQQDGGNFDVYTSQAPVLSQTWQQYSYNFVDPPTAVNPQLLAFNVANNTGSIWIDAVSLRVTGAATPVPSPTRTPTPVPTPTKTPTPTPVPTPTPTPTPNPCPKGPIGDANCDGFIDIFDYSLIITHFNQSGTNIPGDVNHDGVVDIFDYSLIVTHFGQ